MSEAQARMRPKLEGSGKSLEKRFLLVACLALAWWRRCRLHLHFIDIPSRSFPTPEKVIEYVVDRVGNGDIAGVLEASAIAEQAKGYDFAAYTKRSSTLQTL